MSLACLYGNCEELRFIAYQRKDSPIRLS